MKLLKWKSYIYRMKKIAISVFITSLLLASCKKDEVLQNEITFTAVTYNVAGLPEGISHSHPQLYSSSISPLLNDYDIIHLQEDFCYHDSILLYDHHPYRTATTGCVPEGSGLNGLSNFKISNIDRISWNDCNGADCLTPKGFYYSQITLLNNDKVDFYDVHCNAGSNDASSAARRGNIAQLCNYIQIHSAGTPVIIMGDFNSRYTRDIDTIRAILGLGFKDVWVELVRSGVVPDISPDNLDECEPIRTYVNCERVDKIFYRGNDNFEITPLSYQVDDDRFYYQGNDTLQLSDHWPVFVTFNIKRK